MPKHLDYDLIDKVEALPDKNNISLKDKSGDINDINIFKSNHYLQFSFKNKTELFSPDKSIVDNQNDFNNINFTESDPFKKDTKIANIVENTNFVKKTISNFTDPKPSSDIYFNTSKKSDKFTTISNNISEKYMKDEIKTTFDNRSIDSKK